MINTVKNTFRVIEGDSSKLEKRCSACKEYKVLSEFAKHVNHNYGVRAKCKKCQSSENTKKDSPYRVSLLKRKYNMTVEDYNNLFLKQEGKCAGCKTHQSSINKTLAVDHCHKTGRVRGLLCSQCNTILGYCKENTETLKNLIDYIFKYKE